MPEAQAAGDPENKAPESLTPQERAGVVEAILFVTGNAVPIADIAKAIGLSDEEMDETLNALESACDYERRGVRLFRYGKHVQLSTRPEYAPYVEKLLQPVQQQTLSQAILETLAVIAYRQPATKGEIEQIRGVKCDYSVQSLLNKGLIFLPVLFVLHLFFGMYGILSAAPVTDALSVFAAYGLCRISLNDKAEGWSAANT